MAGWREFLRSLGFGVQSTEGFRATVHQLSAARRAQNRQVEVIPQPLPARISEGFPEPHQEQVVQSQEHGATVSPAQATDIWSSQIPPGGGYDAIFRFYVEAEHRQFDKDPGAAWRRDDQRRRAEQDYWFGPQQPNADWLEDMKDIQARPLSQDEQRQLGDWHVGVSEQEVPVRFIPEPPSEQITVHNSRAAVPTLPRPGRQKRTRFLPFLLMQRLARHTRPAQREKTASNQENPQPRALFTVPVLSSGAMGEESKPTTQLVRKVPVTNRRPK